MLSDNAKNEIRNARQYANGAQDGVWTVYASASVQQELVEGGYAYRKAGALLHLTVKGEGARELLLLLDRETVAN